MITFNKINSKIWSKLGSRGAFGVAMLELGKDFERVVALTSDLCNTSGLDRFSAAYPERFFNIGIAEQNMTGIAAGISSKNFIVFTTTFSNFSALRSCEQIRHFLGYMKSNVKIVGLAAGFAMGMFGNTHYGVEDIAVMRSIPNITVLSPADSTEVIKTVMAAAQIDGPVYIRLTGTMNNPIVYSDNYQFEVGKAIKLKEGKDVTIIATGTMVYQSLEAASLLEENGVSTCVIDMHTIKPLDTLAIDQACDQSRLVITVEEHSVIGGLGSAVAEYKSKIINSPPQLIIGAEDLFRRAGDYKYMLEQNGLTSGQIADKIIKTLNK